MSVLCTHVLRVKTSAADLYQKPKTLQSVLVSLVLHFDESNKIDKSLKNKYHSSSGIVSLVSNSGQKCFILKNSLKIGFIVSCCFLFFKTVFL